METEPEAAKVFEKRMGIELREIGFIKSGKFSNAGGSPDRETIEQFPGIIEIKCHSKLQIHDQYRKASDNNSFKKLDIQKYWQNMANMMFGNYHHCYHVSYYKWSGDKDKGLRVIKLYPDKLEFEFLEERLEKAHLMLADILQEYDAL